MASWPVLRNLLTILTVVLFLVAWNRGIALLYGMFALVAGTLVTAWMGPPWRLRGIQARRQQPAPVTAGEDLPITLEIDSRCRFRRYMVEIWDEVPCAPESERQPRLLLPQARGWQQVTMEVRCERRGVYTLGPLTLHSGYPLGLRSAQRILPESTQSVVVYPRTFAVRHCAALQRSTNAAVGYHTVTRLGSSEAFVGVREYRSGDSRRHIHWPSSARRGTLIVKEYEGLTATTLVLVLDLQQRSNYGTGQHSTLEYAITITASLAQYALAQGHRVGVFGYGHTPLQLMPEANPQQMLAILEALARVQADGTLPYAEAVRQVQYQVRHTSVLVLFDNPSPDGPGAPPLVLENRSAQSACMWVHFHTASFLRKAPASPPPLGIRSPYHYFVKRDDNLAEVFAV